MSRGWIIGIVSLTIVGNSMLEVRAQEGPSQGSTGMSFGERLSSLRETFSREQSAQKISRKSQPTKKPKTKKPSKKTPTLATLFGRKQAAPSDSSRANRKPTKPKVAKSQRSSKSQRIASTQRAGSTAGKPIGRRRPHISPASKEMSLDSALSDLLSTEDRHTEQTFQVLTSDEASPAVVKKSKHGSNSGHTMSFDVHRALVGEETLNVSQTPAKSESPPTASEVIRLIDEPKAIVESSLVDKHESYAKSQPKRQSPLVQKSRPLAIETLPGVESSQSAIIELPSTVELQPSPNRYPKTEHPSAIETVTKRYEAAAEKAFTTNSMRQRSGRQTLRSDITDSPTPNLKQPSKSARNSITRSYEQPLIVSHVEGPKTIMVGREASYQVTLENKSKVDAEDISASVRIPEWAELVDVISTSGAVERGQEGNDGDVLNWQIREIAAKSSATLRMRLIPRSGRPLKLSVQWSQAPMHSETTIEVQEPKIEVDLSGPQEVLFGQPQRYRLILKNPGTGVANHVEVQLIPPGGDKQSATNQVIGSLQPGEVKEIEIELTAREAGELVMQASVVADGGLSDQTVKKVLCRKPELAVDWRGPETKYAGTVSAYYIRVQNPGSATTEPVTVTVELPKGAQFVSASEGHSFDQHGKTVSWQLAGLSVDEAQYLQIRCQLDSPGLNQFNVTAQIESGKLSDTKVIQTQIVALADLKLEVTDPQGPLPLGDSALYEIRIQNRGTSAAKGINVTGLFSAGIEPVSIEGAQYTERDGRVTFHPIKSLPAGKEVVLRIRAKADQAGTHIFRAEVACQDLDIKLAAEETTRFYKDEFRWEDGQTPYSAENSETVNR